MRIRIIAFMAVLLAAAPAAYAQEITAPAADSKPTLQEKLMPEATMKLTAPASVLEQTESNIAQPATMQRGGSGVGMMIAGAALFVAGILIEGDAGTLVMVTGAAVGAYGLYLHFR